jgi:hypothetical protein
MIIESPAEMATRVNRETSLKVLIRPLQSCQIATPATIEGTFQRDQLAIHVPMIHKALVIGINALQFASLKWTPL